MQTVKEFVAERKKVLSELAQQNGAPQFVVIQVGDVPSSNAYVRGKLKDANEIGILPTHIHFSEDITQEKLLAEVERINRNPKVCGLIVQLPLPRHISEEAVKLAIDPKKDIDGFHPLSSFDPCTPKGIILYLESIGFSFAGKNAVVLGRSNIVGKPMARMLLARSCNVTVLHSKTSEEDKAFYIAHADLIVVAIGKQGFLDRRFVYKPTAIVVDVGINRGEDGHLHGDAIPELPVALQTPVPGGVGLLTRLALMQNILEAHKK
ncbi:MAG: bifunctional 5,10-methylenetetrahydrofolate dehydrogenase/5,10-methenyltetrahydrofolate cyclohydrolase [Candidatus Enteromonas sp.]|nr:bifunctional 5,10-methylenetetrahydrofolate dehydrogenase/5,10-methenyltetrahydrofolate cyclohydrolase [Candidatus Enteromonas sp.]